MTEDPRPPLPSGASERDEAEPQEPDMPEKAPWVLVAQFFVIPLIVVILAVSVFLLFGWFSREQRSPAEYLGEVRTGSLNRRWQAAFELSKELARDPALARDDALFKDTLASFEGARSEPRIRRYLALALGHFARPEAVSALVQGLEDSDEETRVYAALALGSIKSTDAVAPLLGALKAETPSLRKVAAFALGQIADPGAASGLKVAAEDARFDVALQAACSLAQLGSADGLTVLHRALDRKVVGSLQEMNDDQQAEAMANAMRALVLVRNTDSIPLLREIAKSDPSLRVRDAALRAAEALAGPAPRH